MHTNERPSSAIFVSLEETGGSAEGCGIGAELLAKHWRDLMASSGVEVPHSILPRAQSARKRNC